MQIDLLYWMYPLVYVSFFMSVPIRGPRTFCV